MSVLQKIAEVESEINKTQKNKATNYHIGLLKAKLSKLRAQLLEGGGSKGGKVADSFEVGKTGDVRLGLIGFPSVGKSTLLNKLTGVHSEVAAYEFTTLTCVPGVFQYRGAKIQLLDLPGIIEGAKDGKGRGKQVIAVGRTCNLLLIVLDATKPMAHKRVIERELDGFGIRLNKRSPDITIQKKDKGGIQIVHTVAMTNIDDETIKSICHEYKMGNAVITVRCNATVDDVIDVIEGNRVYIPAVYVLNKVDAITLEELGVYATIPDMVPVSAQKEWNFHHLLNAVWKKMNLIRVYTKPKGQIPDYETPVILPAASSTVENFCQRIHRQLLSEFRTAVIWGTSVKHNPQKVGKDHHLQDEDVVQIVKC